MKARQRKSKDYIRKTISLPIELDKKIKIEAEKNNLSFTYYVILKLSS